MKNMYEAPDMQLQAYVAEESVSVSGVGDDPRDNARIMSFK